MVIDFSKTKCIIFHNRGTVNHEYVSKMLGVIDQLCWKEH